MWPVTYQPAATISPMIKPAVTLSLLSLNSLLENTKARMIKASRIAIESWDMGSVMPNTLGKVCKPSK